MHKEFYPSALFASYERGLFKTNEPAWAALDHLKDFLHTHPLGERRSPVPEGVHLENPDLIYIGEEVEIEPGAFIRGPCFLSRGASVRHGAYIRGNVYVGPRSVIGHSTEIKNSILLEKAQAAHFAYVGDSILGNGVNLGAGTRLANLRLDHGEVKIFHQGASIGTSRRKLGAIIGDDVQLGCNTVCNPGTIIGPRARSYPCTNFGGIVPSDGSVRPAAPCRIREPVGRR